MDTEHNQILMIHLIGEFKLCWGEIEANLMVLRQRKGRDLIKLLALEPSHSLHSRTGHRCLVAGARA